MREVVRRYYGLDGPAESQAAVAHSLGIARETVRDVLRSRAVRSQRLFPSTCRAVLVARPRRMWRRRAG